MFNMAAPPKQMFTV